MKVLSVSQIRAWDAYTIQNEPIASLALMERASGAFVRWFCERFDNHHKVVVVCGMGNNGGDGLAVARMLIQKSYNVEIFVVKHISQGSDDFEANYQRLLPLTSVKIIESEALIPELPPTRVIIDALLGSGLSRPVEGVMCEMIRCINDSDATVVSIDIASGLYSDGPNAPTDTIIQPSFTVTFQCPKLTFFHPQSAAYVGEWQVVDIGLHNDYLLQIPDRFFFTQSKKIVSIGKKRGKFSHKGSFGHALLIGGSYGKIGAMVLSTKACLRSGVGLLTVQVPRCGYDILQTTVPEAMVKPDWHWSINTQTHDLAPYTAVGIGPGLGNNSHTLMMLTHLLRMASQPMVLDADALNLIGENPDLKSLLPTNTILTPHPREFQRLLGKTWGNDFEKLELLTDFAKSYQVIVCLKGAHTAVALPDGTIHFNSTGNPGMATAGSGDVLTGIITGLLAQGLSPQEAAIFGVFQHGAAGDRAAQKCTQPALIASDIINEMGW